MDQKGESRAPAQHPASKSSTLDGTDEAIVADEADAWRPCECAEARLLRDVLCGRIPAAGTPMWNALLGLVEVAAVRRLRLVSHDLAGAQDWRRVAERPSDAVLRRRRADPGPLHREFVKRHGGPYLGGPVDWVTGRPARREVA